MFATSNLRVDAPEDRDRARAAQEHFFLQQAEAARPRAPQRAGLRGFFTRRPRRTQVR